MASPGSATEATAPPERRRRAEGKGSEGDGKTIRKLLAGGGAGAISRTLTAPLERTKVLLQTQAVSKVPLEQQYKGIADCLVRIPREEGFAAYWRGNGTNVLRIVPNSAIKFASFSRLKELAFPDGESAYEGKEKFYRKMVCGGLSGVTTIIPVYPLDLARTRLSADTQRRYSGVRHLLRTTVAKEGVGGLYKGLGISLCGIMPYLAISLSTYDTLKDATRGEAHWEHPLGKVVLGSFAAILSQSIAYPIDTIRRHMQVSGALGQQKMYNGTLDCIRKIYASNGMRGFYKGLLANASRAAPQTGIEFACFDVIASLITQTQPVIEKPFRALSGAAGLGRFAGGSSSSSSQAGDDGPDDADGDEDEEEDAIAGRSTAGRLVRRFSTTLPRAEEERVHRVFAAVAEGCNESGEISRACLERALIKLGYEDYEIDGVLGTAQEVPMIGFFEFRRLCQDRKVLDYLEQYNDQ